MRNRIPRLGAWRTSVALYVLGGVMLSAVPHLLVTLICVRELIQTEKHPAYPAEVSTDTSEEVADSIGDNEWRSGTG